MSITARGSGTAATVIKTMTLLQSILTFAVSEELIEYNARRAVPKPEYQRARAHIFLPADVESIRGKLDSPRDRTLVSVLMPKPGCAPKGTGQRDLRSSYVTVQV